MEEEMSYSGGKLSTGAYFQFDGQSWVSEFPSNDCEERIL